MLKIKRLKIVNLKRRKLYNPIKLMREWANKQRKKLMMMMVIRMTVQSLRANKQRKKLMMMMVIRMTVQSLMKTFQILMK